MTTTREYILGLDLGQAKDFTALTVLERESQRTTIWGPPGMMTETHYSLRHLQRYELGTPYPQIVTNLKELLARTLSADPMGKAPLAGCTLAVDATGCGRPVLDMIREADLDAHLVPVTITAGHQVTAAGGGFNVPKKDLVSAALVLLQGRRLSIARGLPLTDVLVRELLAFRVKITASKNETFESWRENDHDDLVLAVAMAAWVAERGDGRTFPPMLLGGGWRQQPVFPIKERQ